MTERVFIMAVYCWTRFKRTDSSARACIEDGWKFAHELLQKGAL